MLANSLFAMGSCSSNDEPEIPVNPENPTESEAAGTMVIYEANPRFFATDNCLNAINARLDEIKELGTTVLWIMPVCEPGELKSVGSPYCIKDYKASKSTIWHSCRLEVACGQCAFQGYGRDT